MPTVTIIITRLALDGSFRVGIYENIKKGWQEEWRFATVDMARWWASRCAAVYREEGWKVVLFWEEEIDGVAVFS